MFKTGLTQASFSNFLTNYQSFHSTHDSFSKAFVYVDASGFKLLTHADLQHEYAKGIFALSTTGDGIIEALSLSES